MSPLVPVRTIFEPQMVLVPLSVMVPEPLAVNVVTPVVNPKFASTIMFPLLPLVVVSVVLVAVTAWLIVILPASWSMSVVPPLEALTVTEPVSLIYVPPVVLKLRIWALVWINLLIEPMLPLVLAKLTVGVPGCRQSG